MLPVSIGPAFRGFERRVEFQPDLAEELLRSIPAAPGVFALRGEQADAQPYLTRAADLRRRLRRLLLPPEAISAAASPEPDGSPPAAAPPLLSKRLNLRSRVRWIEWTRTGSEFESTLLLYHATRVVFGAERARERLKLYPPFVLRLTSEHEHPRLYVTHRLSRKSLPESFGPFPSRNAAERYAEAVSELFKLRRCHENLVVHPDHPGCAYGEMKLCLAPCRAAVTRLEYAAESARVHAFLSTHGGSLLHEIARDRETASECMDFEAAARLHSRWEKVKGVADLADEVVRPIGELCALVVQEAAPAHGEGRSEDAAVFLLNEGRLAGPERLSTLGVRAVREQTAVGSSLFAQPLMLAAVPEGPMMPSGGEDVGASLSPEDRAQAVLTCLAQSTQAEGEPEADERADVMALFKRWYFRPEKQRAGEVFLPNPDGGWPIRRLLNGAARVVLGPPAEMSPVDREAAREVTKALKTRVLHEGREGVERVVPVLPRRTRRSSKAHLPSELKA